MRDWKLIEVVSGNFSVKCDHCPRICRRRYQVVQNRETNEIMNVGTSCAFELTGVRNPRPEPMVIDPDGGVPDWMLS